MKKIAHLVLAASLVILFSSFAYANGLQPFQLIGREVFPGIDLGDKRVGALFIGKFFDEDWTEIGRFSVILDNDGENIEICEGETELIRFNLIMNFHNGARLALVGPRDGVVNAYWGWNDPACSTGNCPLISYAYYVDLFDVGTGLIPCTGTDSFIAEVPLFGIARQRFGSYGTTFTGGSVSGWLVHTPIISPAIFGTVLLNE